MRGPQGLGNGSNPRGGGRERRGGTGGYDQDYYQVLWGPLLFSLQPGILVFSALDTRRFGSFLWLMIVSLANFVVLSVIFSFVLGGAYFFELSHYTCIPARLSL